MSGPLGFLVSGIALWPLAGFLPPLDPSASAQDIAAIYAGNSVGIRLGMIGLLMGASLFVPFWAAISIQMKRMEGEFAPLALTQALAGLMVAIFFAFPTFMFSVAAFRPERSPELIQAFNDFGWMVLVMPGIPATIQTLAFGFAILNDRNPKDPVLPRWAGFFSIWVAILFIPASLAILFKTGPFAWNGILSFWIPAVLVGLWANIMAMLLIKAVKRQAAG